MEEDKIHPTINLETAAPDCDLDYVASTARNHKIQNALLNTLGFGSKCSALIIKK
jgi:3-oxoacyl-[acyl-carrier-protein] synthase II